MQHPDHEAGVDRADRPEEPARAGTPVVVRRNAGLAALIGGAASAIAIAYLWRATVSGAPLDWVLCVAMAGIAAIYLVHLVDARTPLLVADHLGVRIRLGNQWRGLPWDAVDTVLVEPRRGLVRDGRLVFAPLSLARALDGLDNRGRRAASVNQKMYGAPLAVPIGLTTRVSAQGTLLSDELAALASGRADVVLTGPSHEVAAESEPEPETELETGALIEVDDEAGNEHDEGASEEAPTRERRRLLGGLGTIVSRVAKGRDRDLDAAPETTETTESPEPQPEPVRAPVAARSAVAAFRAARPGLRAQVTRDAPATVLGSAALLPDEGELGRRARLPESRELRRFGDDDLDVDLDVDLGRVRPISSLSHPVDALIIDDFVTEPAYDPVIGPELAAARNRVGLSVDELAERTRIRPHVIESIEVDDFAPCGGDFYARGHLRTLARVLGRDPVPLLAQFDQRYATAPINARRVFEAELATGLHGNVRGGSGSPNWALLIGVVLALVMTWGVVRLFASQPHELLQTTTPSLNGSAGINHAQSAAPAPTPRPMNVLVTASHASSRVVVRDRTGKVVWAGQLALGQSRTVRATPKVRVSADNAGAVEVTVAGIDRGTLGELGVPGGRTFVRPASR